MELWFSTLLSASSPHILLPRCDSSSRYNRVREPASCVASNVKCSESRLGCVQGSCWRVGAGGGGAAQRWWGLFDNPWNQWEGGRVFIWIDYRSQSMQANLQHSFLTLSLLLCHILIIPGCDVKQLGWFLILCPGQTQ